MRLYKDGEFFSVVVPAKGKGINERMREVFGKVFPYCVEGGVLVWVEVPDDFSPEANAQLSAIFRDGGVL